MLLNISDINTFDIPTNCKTLSDFLEEILKSDQEKLELHSTDRIPVNLKIKYLLSLTKGLNVEELIDRMSG